MRAVIQRVKNASVTVGDRVEAAIGPGLLVLVGIGRDDTLRDAEWMAEKIVNLRIFETEEGRLDKSVIDMGGELLLVSQFTLYGDCRKGRRPSFSDAMPSEEARRFFEEFVSLARTKGPAVKTGVFQATMDVALVNDGPVTLILDTRE
jgi:D-aminoacyl-tRNA deacylase